MSSTTNCPEAHINLPTCLSNSIYIYIYIIYIYNLVGYVEQETLNSIFMKGLSLLRTKLDNSLDNLDNTDKESSSIQTPAELASPTHGISSNSGDNSSLYDLILPGRSKPSLYYPMSPQRLITKRNTNLKIYNTIVIRYIYIYIYI